jgi:Na+/phosphate symporter
MCYRKTQRTSILHKISKGKEMTKKEQIENLLKLYEKLTKLVSKNYTVLFEKEPQTLARFLKVKEEIKHFKTLL